MSDAAAAAWVHDPDAVTRSFPRRPDSQLPFDSASFSPDLAVMLDAAVYIASARNQLPEAILRFLESRDVCHCGVALAELSVSAGLLDPADSRTRGFRDPRRRSLASIDLTNCSSPSALVPGPRP